MGQILVTIKIASIAVLSNFIEIRPIIAIQCNYFLRNISIERNVVLQRHLMCNSLIHWHVCQNCNYVVMFRFTHYSIAILLHIFEMCSKSVEKDDNMNALLELAQIFGTILIVFAKLHPWKEVCFWLFVYQMTAILIVGYPITWRTFAWLLLFGTVLRYISIIVIAFPVLYFDHVIESI